MGERTGSCLCGGIEFTVTPGSDKVGACHCKMCRKVAAGPFMTIGCDSDFRVTTGEDMLGVFVSSEWAERGFCKGCGSPLFWRLRDGSMMQLSVNSLDDPGTLTFDHEVFIDHKPDYYSFAQKTHQMTEAEVLAAFAEGKSS
ncbi:GFA family protein [Parvularcula marina]|uniref:GFA family protein n=1 Tax=Parvularcula marina TaxID=2292771 RepID=UPI003519D676